MVNSWMDAPSRKSGRYHRRERHDPILTPYEACVNYGDIFENKHLWNWKRLIKLHPDDKTLWDKITKEISPFMVGDRWWLYKDGDDEWNRKLWLEAIKYQHRTLLRYRNVLDIPSLVDSLQSEKRLFPEVENIKSTIKLTPKNLLIIQMVLQHLRLDGLITPREEEILKKYWRKKLFWMVVGNIYCKIEVHSYFMSSR